MGREGRGEGRGWGGVGREGQDREGGGKEEEEEEEEGWGGKVRRGRI